MKTLSILVIPILLLTATPAPAADTPEQVVTRQVEAMRAADWEKFTTCMHGPALEEFQSTVLTMFKGAPDTGVREQILRAYFANKSVTDLTAMTPSVFFAVFMNGLLATNPALRQSMAGAEATVLGHVDEPPDKTHVVSRMTMPLGDDKIVKMEVTTLLREGDSWKALLKGDMQAVITNMSRMLKPK